MTSTKKSTILMFLTAILCLAAMIGVLFIVAPSRPASADEETKTVIELEEKEETGYVPDSDSEMKGGFTIEEKIEEKTETEKEKPASKLATVKGIPDETKLLPHYHILGKYQGYNVEVRAWDPDDDVRIYEYSEVFDYFYRRGDFVWNNGQDPRTCSEYRLAVFNCVDCGAMVVFKLSGRHTFDGESEIVEGYEVKTCSTCGSDVCVDFYKHVPLPENDYLTADVRFINGTTVSVQNLSGLTEIFWGIGTNTESVSNNGAGTYTHTYSISGRAYLMFMGCTDIGDRAFLNCLAVREITVPDVVESVGHNAFSGCNSLERICFLSDTPCEIESDTFSGCTAGIYVPDESVSAYRTAWSNYSNRIMGFSEQEFQEPVESNSGSSGGSFTSYSSGSDSFSLDGIFDGSDNVKIFSAAALLLFVFGLFMIPSSKKRKK